MIRTRLLTRRTSAVLAATALALGGAACGEDVVDDQVEQEVEEGAENVQEGAEDAGQEVEDAVDGEENATDSE